MSKSFIDMTENEDKPIIKEMITFNQGLYRVMNDISEGAMLIKERHRLNYEIKVQEYTSEKLRLLKKMGATGEKIVSLHNLFESQDVIRYVKSYLFQKGCQSRKELEILHDKHRQTMVDIYQNVYNELFNRLERNGIRVVYDPDYGYNTCCFEIHNNSDSIYKNNDPYSEVLNLDLNWILKSTNIPCMN
jgi:hypothetical protein